MVDEVDHRDATSIIAMGLALMLGVLITIMYPTTGAIAGVMVGLGLVILGLMGQAAIRLRDRRGQHPMEAER